MSWWDDLLSDIVDWGSDVWDSLSGFTDEVAKAYAWIGEAVATLARSFYDAIIAFGERIWDAFYNGFSFLRNGLMDLGNGIWVGLTRLGEYVKLGMDALWGAISWIGTQVFSFGKWLWAGISWIGSQLYNFGSWLWDGITWVGETLWDGLKWIGGNLWAGLTQLGEWAWNGIAWMGHQLTSIFGWIVDTVKNFFGNIYNAVKDWFSGVVGGLNTWTSDMLGGFKDKIDDILFANMMVMGSKKIINNLTEGAGDAKSLGDVGYHLIGNVGGAIALPIVGLLMKEILGGTIKTMGGTDIKLFPEETATFKYEPTIELTPPAIPHDDPASYKPTPSMFDSGFTPAIVHDKPEAGTPPGTPVCGECPPSELFMPPGTPTPPEPPYTPPPPEEPVQPEPPFAKSISINIMGGVPNPVVIPEAYYEIPVTVGGGSPSPAFVGMGNVEVGVGGGIPSVEVSLPAEWEKELVHVTVGGAVWQGICVCECASPDCIPVISFADSMSGMNASRLKHSAKREGVWETQFQGSWLDLGSGLQCSCAHSVEFIRSACWGMTPDNMYVIRQTGLGTFILTGVDSLGNVGSNSSMVLDGDDYEHLSYKDITNNKLKYAYWDGAAWQPEFPDGGTGTGYDTAIALFGVNVHIMHTTNNPAFQLLHTTKIGAVWDTEVLFESASYPSDTVMAIGGDGVIHVVYFQDENLKYAYKTGGGWFYETIDSGLGGHRRPGLSLDGNNVPHVSYYDTNNKDLKYANRIGGSWDTEVLDDEETSGSLTSLFVEIKAPYDVLHVSYSKDFPATLSWELWYATKEIR